MTMKKLLLSLALLLGGSCLATVSAWTGNDPSSSTSSAGVTADDKTFVLYNVGADMFMVNGGIWGTQAVLSDKLVTTFNLVKSSNSYQFYTNIETNTGHYMNYSNGSNMANAGSLFLDQGSDTKASTYTFESVSGQTNVYKIKSSLASQYLTAKDDASYGKVIGVTSSANDDNCYWQLVSVKELKANFSVAEGSEAKPASASFMLKDPGFSRGATGISSWHRGKTTNNTALDNNKTYTSDNGNGSDITNSIKPSNAVKITGSSSYTYNVTCYYTVSYFFWSTTESHTFTYTSNSAITTGRRYSNYITDKCDSYNHDEDDISYQYVTLVSSSSTAQAGYKYYVGNGYNEDANGACIENDGTSSHKEQQQHGGQWTANIHGESGDIFQQLSITRPGIYKISCKGFTLDGTGYLFANVGTSAGTAEAETYVTTPLTTITEMPSTYVKASKQLDELGYTSLIIKVQNASDNSPVTLTFGALTKNGSSTSWTCVDNFTLDYCGPIVKDLVLDETQTSIDYINNQVDASNAQTLYLFRTFSLDKWNSLVLPVDMTAEQITTAFGSGTKLSKLEKTDKNGNLIIFEPATTIEAGKLYIIKPQKNITVQEKSFTVEDNEIKIQAYYQCEQIKLLSKLESSEVSGDLVGSTLDNGLKHVGSYVKVDKSDVEGEYAIPAQTYILSGGKWYYNEVGVNTVKGFRGWLATNQDSKGGKQFSINGVIDETTAIEGISAEPVVVNRNIDGVYTLGGQKVRDGQSLQGLAKGLYIVGGKKQVVK